MPPRSPRCWTAAAVIAGAAWVVCVAPSYGSTALVRPSERPFVFGQAQELAYSADPGERNDVVVKAAYFGSPWILRDPGAVIVPGPGCSAIDEHAVQCVGTPTSNPMTGLLFADLSLGDLDDRGTATGPDPFAPVPLYADGGDGNDQIVGTQFGGELRGGPGDDYLTSPTGFAREAVLDGGGGKDLLRGGAGTERFSDGDLEEAGADAALGRDVFDGGAGVDEISYSDRTLPVSVNLAKASGDDGDVIRGIESIVGGAGDDRLAGDANSNTIDGRGGRDTLRGNGGADRFSNGGGRTSCGTGSDLFLQPRSTDMLGPDCEGITLNRYGGQDLPAYPATIGPRSAFYRFSCPRDPEESPAVQPCSTTVTMREATGKRRQLAATSIRRGRWTYRGIKVPFTPLGRRLVSRPNGIAATMRVGISGWPPLKWTIRLTIRRPN